MRRGVGHAGTSQPPDPNGVNVVRLLPASTNARRLWDPDSGPTCTEGEGTARRRPPPEPSRLTLLSALPAGSCRYLPGDSAGLFPTCPSLGVPCPSSAGSSPSLFLSASPGFLPLTNQQLFRSPRRASPSSLPGRLSRALSLGTIPSLTRAGKGRSGISGPGGSWAQGRQLCASWRNWVQTLLRPQSSCPSPRDSVSLKKNKTSSRTHLTVAVRVKHEGSGILRVLGKCSRPLGCSFTTILALIFSAVVFRPGA